MTDTYHEIKLIFPTKRPQEANRISDGAHVVGLGLARLHRMLLDLELAQSRILLREWAPKE